MDIGAAKYLLNIGAAKYPSISFLVSKKELQLLLLLLSISWGLDFFQSVGVESGVVDFARKGHGSWREVLYLFESEIYVLHFTGEFCHILARATRVRGYEVWDYLLIQVIFGVDLVELFFKLFKH